MWHFYQRWGPYYSIILGESTSYDTTSKIYIAVAFRFWKTPQTLHNQGVSTLLKVVSFVCGIRENRDPSATERIFIKSHQDAKHYVLRTRVTCHTYIISSFFLRTLILSHPLFSHYFCIFYHIFFLFYFPLIYNIFTLHQGVGESL